MKRKMIWICLLLAALLLAGAGCEGTEGTPQGTLPSTQTTAPTTQATTGTAYPAPTAPDFTVYDEDGNPHKLSDFFGKPIVLNFWASWCPPCKAEMPEFNEKYLKLGDEIQFLMVNVTAGDAFQDAYDYIQQQGYQFPVFYDHTGEAAYTYMVQSIPVTYFIDAEGRLVTHRVGMLDEEALDYFISLIYGSE